MESILEHTLKQSFIKEFKDKGFELEVIGEDTFLTRGMEAFRIYSNGSIGYSAPSGNAKYSSFEDWNNGKLAEEEKYSNKD